MSCGQNIIFLLDKYPSWNKRPLISAIRMASKGDLPALQGLKCLLEPDIEWLLVANEAARQGYLDIIQWIGTFLTLNVHVLAVQALSTEQWDIYEFYNGFWEPVDPADIEEEDNEQVYKEDWLPESSMPKLVDPYLGTFGPELDLPEPTYRDLSNPNLPDDMILPELYQNLVLDEYQFDQRGITETGFTNWEYEAENTSYIPQDL